MKNNILSTIIDAKKIEVENKKQSTPIEILEKSSYFQNKCLSLTQRLRNKELTGIIAEFKRKSPSKGWISPQANISSITTQYAQQPIAGISILTDQMFFGGNVNDILQVREQIKVPILRKDFIIDEYQLYEAKALGADVVLLIAAVLDKNIVLQLTKTAKSLGLEVLFEIHQQDELQKLNQHIDIVGINNRNLKTFEVDIKTSEQLFELLPQNVAKISESGISNIENIKKLKNVGFDGYLIGEKFMQTNQPAETLKNFIEELNN